MSPEHLRKLAEGRHRAALTRHHNALQAVQAFDQYLKASKRVDGVWPRISMPRIPKDTEWQAAREAGIVP